MKCELKYTIEKAKTVYDNATLKDLIIAIPISIITVFIMNYFIGSTATLLTAIIIYMGMMLFTIYKAVKYCRRK